MGQPEVGAHGKQVPNILVRHHSETLVGVPHGRRALQQAARIQVEVGLRVGGDFAGIVPQERQIGEESECEGVPAFEPRSVRRSERRKTG